MRFRNNKGFMRLHFKIIFLLCLINAPYSAYSGDQITETFHLDGIEQGIFLPVTINELPYTMLVDTGATFTILDTSFMPLLGKPIKKQKAETAIGYDEVALYKPVNINLGNILLSTKHPFLTSDLTILNKVAGIEFHGILGMAVLYKHLLEMNFDDQLLMMTSLPIGDKNRRGFTLLKITPSQQGIPTIPVSVGNEILNFQIDTGDNGFGRLQSEIIDSLISQRLVESVAIDTMVSISGVTEVRRIRVREIEIGGNKYRNVVMRESLQNALGIGFLWQHHVIMDFVNKDFFFKKGLGVFHVEREDKSGLKLISHNNQVVVALADARGPAAKAGIKKGDIVTKLYGSPVSGKDLFKLRNLLKGQDGEEILLVVNRSNENLPIGFELDEGFDFVNF